MDRAQATKAIDRLDLAPSIFARRLWAFTISCMTESPLTRASLLIRLRDHADTDAWSSFLNDYGPMLYRFIRSRGLQDADAADMVQEVMRSVGLAIDRLDYDKEKGGFRAWLFHITRNRLATFYEKRKRQGPVFDESTSEASLVTRMQDSELDQQWELEHQRQLVAQAMDRIQPTVETNTWLAFEMTAIKDVDADEVAAHLGMTKGAVYVARSRVTAKLRKEIERMQADESQT